MSQEINWNRKLLSAPTSRRQSCLGRQWRRASTSAPQTKPTVEAQMQTTFLQNHALRPSLQVSDNNQGNKQDPTTTQNLPTTLPTEALQHAGLVTKRFQHWPKLHHNEEAKAHKQAKDAANNEWNRRRTICFLCWIFQPLIQNLSIQSSKASKINSISKWLRVSMSYHRFTNLKEIFQGDFFKIPRLWTSALSLQNWTNLVSMATTTWAETQQQSAKSNATTQEKCTKETPNKSSLWQHFNEVQSASVTVISISGSN